MKATMKAAQYSPDQTSPIRLSELKREIVGYFVVSERVKSLLRCWFTREWLAEYVRKQIISGQIEYGGIHYNVVWYGVRPADKTHHKWFLSFRAPILGLDCLPYVLITVKKD